MAQKTHYLFFSLTLSTFLLATYALIALNTDFGNLQVSMISISDGEEHISGLLFRPHVVNGSDQLPGIVLTHGIGSTKQTMCDLALELARNGFASLAIDLIGHGDSTGRLEDSKDLTLGTLAAVRYLESQPFVKASSIGLVGHSLGAGAVRATAVAHGNIAASVFIGGGFGAMLPSSQYGILNSTFPKNLLFAIGEYDVLFNLTQVRRDWLPFVFDTLNEVTPGELYGDFQTQNARKLITPASTHLFEPVDTHVVSQTVAWMINSFEPKSSKASREDLIYVYREAAMMASLASMIGIIFAASSLILDSSAFKTREEVYKTTYGVLEDWKTLIVWGALGVLLFLPMSFVGSIIGFPPLIFGGSIAWWMLATAIAGYFLILVALPRFSTVKLNGRKAVYEAFDLQKALIAVVLISMLYLVADILETFFAINLGIIAPFFKILSPPSRIPLFVLFIPYFLIYFYVEGLYLHEFHDWSFRKSDSRSEAASLIKAIGVKIAPYLALLVLQYIPMVLLGILLIPVFAAFLVEFLWVIAAIFIISTACSWWFYRRSSTIGLGVFFNAFMFAWIAAAVFPF